MDLINNKRTIITLAGVLLLIVALGIGLYLVQQRQVFKPKAFQDNVSDIPLPQEPETSFSLVGAQDVSVGEKFHVILMARSDTDAANLFAAKIKFPASLLSVDSVDVDGEEYFVRSWVEKHFDNTDGTVSLVGGVPNPGFSTLLENPPSAMADITFTAKAAGKADVVFNADSAIYRNSDNFNILTIKRELSVNIQEESVPQACSACTSDIDQSGKVDEVDFARLQACFGKDVAATDEQGNSCILADLNNNGSVEIQDLSCLRTVMNQTCAQTPGTSTSSSKPVPTGAPSFEIGDVNADSLISLVDMSALLSKMGKSGTEAGSSDLNKDGIVNSFDYAKMINILLENKVIKK